MIAVPRPARNPGLLSSFWIGPYGRATLLFRGRSDAQRTMIEQLTSRLRQCRTFDDAIETILGDTVALHGAEYGDIQLRAGKTLLIVAQRNLTSDFLDTFREVDVTDGSACGRAMRVRSTIVIEDVETDSEYAPFREAARKARYRSVQTTPLCTKRDRMLGAVSTLFVNPHVPTRIELNTLERYSRIAADYLLDMLDGRDLKDEARRLNASLYRRARVDLPAA